MELKEKFRRYLEKIGFQSATSYISYFGMLKTILREIDEYSVLELKEQFIKFSKENNEFKNEFNRHHGYASPDTFSDLRSCARKFVNYLMYEQLLEKFRLYNENPYNFPLHDAYWFFKVFENGNRYPVKAIFKNNEKVFDLPKGYTIDRAKSKLKEIFGEKNIKFIDTKNENNQVNTKQGSNNMKIKNIILYGAPGVGKTYNYKRLISLIENGKNDKEIFKIIEKNEKVDTEFDDAFDRIKNENRVEFVTFHQSYSYEDFIEGFRPNEDNKISLENGIFKTISQKAEENLKNSKKDIEQLEKEVDVRKKFEAYITDRIENDTELTLKKGDKFSLIEFKNDKLYFNTSKNSNVNETLYLKYEDFLTIFNSSRRPEISRDILEILEKNTIQQSYTYFLSIYNDFTNFINNNPIEERNANAVHEKNYYLIIDEINRGNISKIFGELITLIEEDKRDTYEVTLPYSKEKFKIPSNLFIIATMNSTDKSIATIDIALRRRFTFLKMLPNPDLVENEKARRFMKAINEYLSEDYQIGHSYFMGNDIDLDFVKEYKIKPLLEEYFYANDKSADDIMQDIERKLSLDNTKENEEQDNG